eukprot:m.4393 g.4393  ORF g.4393 m.4393 type:complete len:80 (+) comp5002_c0_seq1:194-433(+)
MNTNGLKTQNASKVHSRHKALGTCRRPLLACSSRKQRINHALELEQFLLEHYLFTRFGCQFFEEGIDFIRFADNGSVDV